MLLDELADFVSIFIRHDHVGDDNVRPGLLELAERGGGIVVGDHVDVLAAEGDLYHLAHGRAVINEINRRGGAHRIPPSGSPSCAFSSTWRKASSIRSVGDRSTVRVVASAPGMNL